MALLDTGGGCLTKVEQADVAMPCLSNRTLFTLMLLVGLYFPSSAGGGWSTLRQMGLNVKRRSLTRLWTTAESLRIWRRGIRLTAQDRAAAKRLAADLIP